MLPSSHQVEKTTSEFRIESQAVPSIGLHPINYAYICGICGSLAQLIKIMSWMIKALLWSANLFLCLEAPASNTLRASANEPEMSLPLAVLSRTRWMRISNPQASLCSSRLDNFSFALTTVRALRCCKTSCLQPGLSEREPFVPGFHLLSWVQSWLKTTVTVIRNISLSSRSWKTNILGPDSLQTILFPKSDLDSTQEQISANLQLGLMEKVWTLANL